MTPQQVMQEFRDAGALLDGHFLLSSGLHSRYYLQCARVLMDTKRAERLCAALSVKVREIFSEKPEKIDYVVSPAMGGVVVGYEMARQLGVSAMFLERVDGRFELRRGFGLAPKGKTAKKPRILMVEDIITTGLSSREAIAAIGASGGNVMGAACLIDRSGGTADIGVDYVCLAEVNFETFNADELPEDLQMQPAIKPGSRGLA